MAVKKSSQKKDVSATPTKAAATEGAQTTSKKGGATKGAATKGGATKGAATKASAPKSSAPASPAKGTEGGAAKGPKAAKPKAAPIKLTSSQSELLKRVHGAGEGGYSAEKKIEERSLTALLERKLIKKGAKNKETGKIPHTLSSAGKKHIEGEAAGGGASS